MWSSVRYLAKQPPRTWHAPCAVVTANKDGNLQKGVFMMAYGSQAMTSGMDLAVVLFSLDPIELELCPLRGDSCQTVLLLEAIDRESFAGAMQQTKLAIHTALRAKHSDRIQFTACQTPPLADRKRNHNSGGVPLSSQSAKKRNAPNAPKPLAKKKAKIVKTKVPPDEKEDEKKESKRAKVKLSAKKPANDPKNAKKLSIHDGIACVNCGVEPIQGTRYRCTVCKNFDLCEACEAQAVHPAEHPLLKKRVAEQEDEEVEETKHVQTKPLAVKPVRGDHNNPNNTPGPPGSVCRGDNTLQQRLADLREVVSFMNELRPAFEPAPTIQSALPGTFNNYAHLSEHFVQFSCVTVFVHTI